MSSTISQSLQAFDPLAEYYFTSATGTTRPEPIHSSGVPRAVYPSHVLVASSTSPASSHSAGTTPKNNSVPSQSTPHRSTAGVQIQAPQPMVHSRGFTVPGAKTRKGNAIFEPFAHTRSITPELDDVLKKKSAASWGQWELEQ